jgi:mediator of RNA polymerase II transcription subunit 5
VLLRIAPALFSSAIQTTMIHKMDKDVLLNGVSYFTSPLLNWTLVGVIKTLVKDIQRAGYGSYFFFIILYYY